MGVQVVKHWIMSVSEDIFTKTPRNVNTNFKNPACNIRLLKSTVINIDIAAFSFNQTCFQEDWLRLLQTRLPEILFV